MYQERPLGDDYHLPEKGQGLAPVLHAMLSWGSTFVPGTLRKEKAAALLTNPRIVQNNSNWKMEPGSKGVSTLPFYAHSARPLS